jgi:hypothetical protein
MTNAATSEAGSSAELELSERIAQRDLELKFYKSFWHDRYGQHLLEINPYASLDEQRDFYRDVLIQRLNFFSLQVRADFVPTPEVKELVDHFVRKKLFHQITLHLIELEDEFPGAARGKYAGSLAEARRKFEARQEVCGERLWDGDPVHHNADRIRKQFRERQFFLEVKVINRAYENDFYKELAKRDVKHSHNYKPL